MAHDSFKSNWYAVYSLYNLVLLLLDPHTPFSTSILESRRDGESTVIGQTTAQCIDGFQLFSARFHYNQQCFLTIRACLLVSCNTHAGLSRLSISTLIVQRILIPHSKLLNSTGSIQIQAPCCVCHLPYLRIWLQFFIRPPHIYLFLCSPLNYWDLLVVIRPWSTVRTTDCLPRNISCWPSYLPASPRKQPNQHTILLRYIFCHLWQSWWSVSIQSIPPSLSLSV